MSVFLARFYKTDKLIPIKNILVFILRVLLSLPFTLFVLSVAL